MHRFSNLKRNVTEAVTSAVVGARDLALEAKDGLERALVAKCLRGYTVKGHVATGGSKGVWKIYSADARNQGVQYPKVSVWILDKKFLQDSHKNVKSKLFDDFLEHQRKNAINMLKLKHPGIVKLLEPLEETRTQLIMVTEPITGSLDNILHNFAGVSQIPDQARNMSFSDLEIKHGLLQIADALHFLHSDANLAHCAISPESIFVGLDGQWRLSGLGFCTTVDYTGTIKTLAYDYSNSHPQLWDAGSKPPLQYVAPELASGHGRDLTTNITPACDIFSFGLVAFEVFAKRPLLDVREELMEYKSKVASIGQVDLSAISPQLQYTLRSMLIASPSSRPPASAFSSAPFFQEDKLLRALVFLDSIVQRDNIQKASFLKDLDSFWDQLDSRIIRYKVLPHLLQELHNPSMQGLVIPFIFRSVSSQATDEFELFTLPKLRNVLMSANGEGLLTILKHVQDLAKLMSREVIGNTILPMFIRALDEKNPKILDEALKQLQSLVESFEYEPLKGQLLPRVHVICLRTASAKVRINALVLLGSLVPRMDTDEAEKMMHTCSQVSAVDKSPGTLMCVLGVGDAISKQWGAEITAEKVLPLLFPLTVAKGLSHQQFGTYMTLIREMLKRVEDKMGGQLKQSEPMEVTALSSSKTGNQKLEHGWDAGPSAQTAWDTLPTSPIGTASVPVAATGSPSWNQAATPSTAMEDPLFSGLTTQPNPPLNSTPITPLSPPPKANNPSAGLALFDDWVTPNATPQQGGRVGLTANRNTALPGGTVLGALSMGTGGGFAGSTAVGSGGLSSGQVGMGMESFRDPTWKDPPLQSLAAPNSGPSPDALFSGLSLGQNQSTLGIQPRSNQPSHGNGQSTMGHGTNFSTGGFAQPMNSSLMGQPMAMAPSINSGMNGGQLQSAPGGARMSMGGFGQQSPAMGGPQSQQQNSQKQQSSGDPFLDLLS
ncbi:hypothetical protein BSKO_02222 [Bryopsis sp. KO-2023]|nr:hypothetical protein BSKO_02222 [Bryopsis sp. KO-2023]